MKILILGVSGLIGHKLYQILASRFDDVRGTFHGDGSKFSDFDIFFNDNCFKNIEAADWNSVENLLNSFQPDVVLNCAGITKRRREVNVPLHAISVNSLFPHLLAKWALENDSRVIQFSTDCVFDGALGNYDEQSHTTGEDAYGKTKALGEIRYDHTLTIRSSFIGRELAVHSELLDWFLAQDGKTIKGFTKAWYSGISTIEMARIIGDIIEHHPEISGLHQLATEEPVSKFDLLNFAKDAFHLDVEILPDESFEIQPTLNGSLLRSKMKIDLPSWPDMMAELAADETPYPKLS